MRKVIWLTLIIATLVTNRFLVAYVHASTQINGIYATPRPIINLGPIATPSPTPTPTATPTPSPKVMPGSPLSMGGESFAEVLSQFDITQLVTLVLTSLGTMWAIVILFMLVDTSGTKKKPKNEGFDPNFDIDIIFLSERLKAISEEVILLDA